jgi:hypothetical protein
MEFILTFLWKLDLDTAQSSKFMLVKIELPRKFRLDEKLRWRPVEKRRRSYRLVEHVGRTITKPNTKQGKKFI